MSFSNPILPTGTASNQSVYSVVTTPVHPVGTRGVLQDGRVFEYVRSKNSTAIPKGNLVTYDPIAAAIDKLDVAAAAAIGDTSIQVTVATASDNLYQGAYLSVEEGPGEAELYRITGHLLNATTTTFFIDRPLTVALTTATNVTIVENAGAVKLSAAVTAQAQPVEVAAGVALVAVGAGDTTNQYFWVQKQGLANVLFSAGVGAVGKSIMAGANPGSVQVASYDISAAADIDAFVSLGTIASLLPITTEFHVVRLNIA